MTWDQNRCRQKRRGSKDLLVIDNLITKQARRKSKNIAMSWIDYQKAFDSVPHSWLLKFLEIYEINKKTIDSIEVLMATWRTTHIVKTKTKGAFIRETA